MSIDFLQERIRKTKNPALLELTAGIALPPEFAASGTLCGTRDYCMALLEGLRDKLPGVRFGFAAFAVLGTEGLGILSQLLREASSMGYYVLLDAPEIFSAASAQAVADGLFMAESVYPCDGLVVPAYPGSDAWKPFLPYCVSSDKDIFVAARTGNRSAPEIQNLLSGGRLVHTAAVDHVNRYGAQCVGKCGYSRVSAMVSASFPDGVRSIRGKYPRLFLLLDGYDMPSANAKNCAAAFDKLGYGAAICPGGSIANAWRIAQTDGADWLAQSRAAADRVRKNIGRYIAIL